MLAYIDEENNKLFYPFYFTESKKLSLGIEYQATEYYSYKDKDRFHELLETIELSKNIKDFNSKKVQEKFNTIAGISSSDTYKYEDIPNAIGYRVVLKKDKPVIIKYKLLNPQIINFFNCWRQCPKKIITWNNLKLPDYDLSNLFGGMENYKDLSMLLSLEKDESLKKKLYEEFIDFAIFYYEIYPEINIMYNTTENITSLHSSNLFNSYLPYPNTSYVNNGKVLKLIKNGKN